MHDHCRICASACDQMVEACRNVMAGMGMPDAGGDRRMGSDMEGSDMGRSDMGGSDMGEMRGDMNAGGSRMDGM